MVRCFGLVERLMNIEAIRRDIEGVSEDGRFSAWMELYTSTEALAKQELGRIVKETDPILKFLFLRFLGRVAEGKSVEYILSLLEDRNPKVMAQAMRSFERNRWEDKLQRLIPLIHSAAPGARLYAIEKLSEGGVADVLDPILKMLPSAREEILLPLLKALSHFSSPKILDAVRRFLNHSEEEIRFRAVLVLRSLYEAGVGGVRPALLKGLEEESFRVRQAVLWALRSRSSRKDLSLLFSISVSDPSEAVRQESILAFAQFPTLAVIRHLLKLMVTEKKRTVVLRAEAVLMGFSTRVLLKGLKKLLKQDDAKMRSKALLMITDFQRGSKTFFNFLAEGLKKETREKEKLPWIEALGVLDLPEGVPLLTVFLVGSPLLGYTACAALLKIWSHYPESVPLIKYLRDPQVEAILKQIILKQMLRKGGELLISEEMVACWVALLQDENLNIRYLTTQLLALTERAVILDPLIETVLEETNPTLIRFLQESIRALLDRHPELVAPLFVKYRERSSVILLLFSILMKADFHGEVLLKMLASLMERPPALHQTEHGEQFALLVFFYLSQRRIRLEDFLRTLGGLRGKEHFLTLIVGQLAREGPLNAQLPISMIARWIQEENEEAKTALLDLLAQNFSKEAVALLVSVLCNSDLKKIHRQASLALNKILPA